MSRSLYKPNIPQDLRLLNLTKEQQAFFRADDKRDRTDVWRFPSRGGATLVRLDQVKFRMLLHGGNGYGKWIVYPNMAGFRLGEFRLTKQSIKNIHIDNRLSKKLQKKRQRLFLEAQKRKARKKKKTLLKEKKRARDKAKAKAKIVRLRAATSTNPGTKSKK